MKSRISELRLLAQELEIQRLVSMICDIDNDRVWSVRVPDKGQVTMVYIGYAPLDGARSLFYSTADALPEWVKDRIAVLRMLPPSPSSSAVYNVGRRVDKTTYWVVESPKGEQEPT
jgi:hypothetical protein